MNCTISYQNGFLCYLLLLDKKLTQIEWNYKTRYALTQIVSNKALSKVVEFGVYFLMVDTFWFVVEEALEEVTEVSFNGINYSPEYVKIAQS